jgi:hypothetical protein
MLAAAHQVVDLVDRAALEIRVDSAAEGVLEALQVETLSISSSR